MYRVNVEIVRDCLEWCKNRLDTQFIQLGSVSIRCCFLSKKLYRIIVDNMYSGTKGAATLLCSSNAKQHNVNVQDIRS
jgi:nucleoside-diphosphate-sugar epimerase